MLRESIIWQKMQRRPLHKCWSDSGQGGGSCNLVTSSEGSWFLPTFLLYQQEAGGSTSVISASFCSLTFSVNTAMRIHLLLPSIVYSYVNKLSLSIRVPVVSFADLLFSVYLKDFLWFILTSGAVFLSFSVFVSLSFISQWLNFIL